MNRIRDTVSSVLLVIAHPDDETLWGGLIGRFRENGIRISCLCVTRGEGSPTNFVSQDLRHLGDLRPRELLESAQRLGISEVVQLDEPDVPFFKPGTVEFLADADEFERRGVWNVNRIANEIQDLAERVRPELVLTLLPDHPLTHPHHKLSARIALRNAESGRLGTLLKGVYGSPELAWYPEVAFKPNKGQVHFPLSLTSETLGCSYAQFQFEAARAHASQVTGYKGLLEGEEVLIPLIILDPSVQTALIQMGGRMNLEVNADRSRQQLASTEVMQNV